MNTPVKTFSTPITDEYGGVYPLAFVAIRAFSESSQTTGITKDCYANYAIEAEMDAITYKVNYWYTDATKSAGKRSRPLLNDVDGTFSDVFTVDIDDPKVIEVLNGPLDQVDNILQAIEVDVKQKNA